MEVARLAQTRPDLERRPWRQVDADDDSADQAAAPEASLELYGMLGYRGVAGNFITRQWLPMRCISL